MLKGDIFSRDLIAEAIRSVIDQVVSTHFDALTQEHQLTSRIAGTLEAKLNGLIVNDYSLRVIAQEIPDKGPGTLESKTGIDLYIGIEVVDRDIVSKGILVQAKWTEAKRSSRERQELVAQCEKMTVRSKSAYVWLYGPYGAEVIPAEEVIQNSDSAVESLASRKTNQLFQQILDCFEGDRKLALPPDGPDFRSRLSAMLREFDVKSGIDISVTRLREVERPRRRRAPQSR